MVSPPPGFSRAHAAWVTTSAAVRTELVQEVLDGKPGAADHAHRVLGYALTRRHAALVVWADDLERTDPGRTATGPQGQRATVTENVTVLRRAA